MTTTTTTTNPNGHAHEQLKLTHDTLTREYGATMTPQQVAPILGLSHRALVANLPTMGIAFRKTGRTTIIPTSAVAGFLFADDSAATGTASNGINPALLG